MRKFITTLLGKPSASHDRPDARPNERSNPFSDVQQPLEAFMDDEVGRVEAFTPQGKVIVAKHLRSILLLHANTANLPLKEVRAATKAAEAALSDRASEILGTDLPLGRKLADFVGEIHRKAFLRKTRVDQVLQMRRAGIRAMTLMTAKTGTECEWCLSKDGARFPVTEDVDFLLASNCSCSPYPGCVFNAVVNV